MHEPLTESKLAPIKVGAGLPPSIPPGLRALSVRVNDVIGLGPGTRVDVLVTIKDQTESLRRAVVSNIQVLTAGTLDGRENAKDGQPAPASVVTLIVTPDEAEKLTLAQKVGALTLVPRNPTTETNGARRRSRPARQRRGRPYSGTRHCPPRRHLRNVHRQLGTRRLHTTDGESPRADPTHPSG
jgi:pilus assembly protein CpaB